MEDFINGSIIFTSHSRLEDPIEPTNFITEFSGIIKAYIDDIQDEVEVVERAFAKGVTSKADSQGYGRGLFNVRSVLDKRKGFISLRTGRIGVYRDFKLEPLTEKEQMPLSLFDEMNKKNSNYNELATAEGLACSILVPLR